MVEKFGEKQYISLLKFFKESGYAIKGFNQRLTSEKTLILRHDIDFSPNMALKFAKIENHLNIKSTYFFLVSSYFYNIFSENTLYSLKNIILLGHEIGLHFDPSIHKKKDIDYFCNVEAEVLEKACNTPVKIVSFHRPLKQFINNNNKIGKFKHTYMKEYFEKICYCSDSEGRWRFKKPWELIKEGANKKKFHIQLLTHPIWWLTPSNLSPKDKIKYFFKKYQKERVKILEKNSKPFRNNRNEKK